MVLSVWAQAGDSTLTTSVRSFLNGSHFWQQTKCLRLAWEVPRDWCSLMDEQSPAYRNSRDGVIREKEMRRKPMHASILQKVWDCPMRLLAVQKGWHSQVELASSPIQSHHSSQKWWQWSWILGMLTQGEQELKDRLRNLTRFYKYEINEANRVMESELKSMHRLNVIGFSTVRSPSDSIGNQPMSSYFQEKPVAWYWLVTQHLLATLISWSHSHLYSI